MFYPFFIIQNLKSHGNILCCVKDDKQQEGDYKKFCLFMN